MRIAVLLLAAVTVGCAGKPAAAPAPAPAPQIVRTPPETVVVRDPETAAELGRVKVQLLERTARIADLERRLNESTTEVVRAMARLRTLATRAEAASAIAEAEVTLQQLRGRAGAQAPPEVAQTEATLRSASQAFDAENFGGAVYLATQAKRIATTGRGRLADVGGTARATERAFAIPVPLTTTSTANLRTAPSGGSSVVSTVPAGTALTAYSYEQDWLKVATADGVSAWVHQSVVRSASATGPSPR
ncbi:MAG TPA: SH3 domain-containing protein [Gemmatimonadales bacterium]|nr:SH3 domain-containing protein [Gemmatimonadales bacterium]